MADEHGRATLLHGGTVRTMTGSGPAEAVLLRGGRIEATGTVDELRSRAGVDGVTVDVEGASVVPGLVDTHPHLLHYGTLAVPLVDVTDARDHADLLRRIRERAAATPAGEWIMTTPVGEAHYFIRRSFHDLSEGTLPTRAALDTAAPDHPVIIQAWAPRIPNALALNSAGLVRLGIDRDTPDRVDDVWIDKDDAGEPTGILRGSVTNYYSEDPFANRLWRQIPFLQNGAMRPGTLAAIAEYHRQGVTAVYENHMMEGPLIDTWRELRDDGELRMRVVTAQEAESYGMPWSRPRSDADFAARLERAVAAIETTDDWFRFTGVSIMLDGGCYGGFLHMREAYRGPYGEPTRGRYFMTMERAEQVMRFAAEHGMRLNVIALGTAAHDDNLTLLERVAATYDIASLRWVLVHGFFVEPGHVERYARLGMDLTTSLSFPWGKGDMFVERLGTGPLEDLLPLRRFFDAGMAVAGGSDWGPKNPWEQIALAMTHEFAGSGDNNLGPAQTITRDEAFAMWTSEGSRLLQWPEIGTLAPGSYADLAIVDRDPVTAPVDELAATSVLRTVVDGVVVHDSGDLAPQ